MADGDETSRHQEFVAQVAKITGKTFIVDPKLKAKNVISRRWATVYALFECIEAAKLTRYRLEMLCAFTECHGKQTPGVLGRPESAAPEELMTEVMVQNTASSELLKLLRPRSPIWPYRASQPQT